MIPPSSVSLDTNWFYVTADVLRKLKFSRYQRSSGARERSSSPSFAQVPLDPQLVACLVKRDADRPFSLGKDNFTYGNSFANSRILDGRDMPRDSRLITNGFIAQMISLDVRETRQRAFSWLTARQSKSND